jgi:hypothetical protein
MCCYAANGGNSSTPTLIDNPTLTKHHTTRCCSAPEVGFEPVLHAAARRRKGSYVMKGETVKRTKNAPQCETRGGKD